MPKLILHQIALCLYLNVCVHLNLLTKQTIKLISNPAQLYNSAHPNYKTRKQCYADDNLQKVQKGWVKHYTNKLQKLIKCTYRVSIKYNITQNCISD